MLWLSQAYSNTPPIDMFDAVVIDVFPAFNFNSNVDLEFIKVRTKNKYSYMSKFLSTSHPSDIAGLQNAVDNGVPYKPPATTPLLTVYRKDRLNNWHVVNTINFWQSFPNENVLVAALGQVDAGVTDITNYPGSWTGQPCTTKKLVFPN